MAAMATHTLLKDTNAHTELDTEPLGQKKKGGKYCGGGTCRDLAPSRYLCMAAHSRELKCGTDITDPYL